MESFDPALVPVFEKLNELALILESQNTRDQKLRMVFDTMSDGLVIQDSKGEVADYNPAALSILGITGDQLLGRTSLDPKWKAIREDGTPYIGTEHPSVVARHSGKKISGTIMGIPHPAGETSWVRVNATPYAICGDLNSNSPSERNVVISFSDITELKKQKTKLQESQYFTSVLANNLPGLIAYWTRDLRCSFANSEYLSWFGRTSEQMKNIQLQELLGAEIFAKNEPYVRGVLAGENQSFERNLIKVNGESRYTWAQYLAHREKGEVVGFFVLVTDITDLKQAEQQLIQNSKLASLGEMAAGMAHEINNPLAIISGSVDLAVKYLGDHEKMKIKIEAIKKASKRIARIVNGLKKFSHSSQGNHFSNHCLAQIAREAMVLTEMKFKQNDVLVTCDFRTESIIHCDEIEIEQVVINLINNAVDAAKDCEEKWVKIQIFDDADSVVLRVSDSGLGIPEKIRDKIFDPFFTTKKVGDGTGLGLSITKGILDQHKATISITAPYTATCFEVRFPKIMSGQAALES